MHNAGFRSLGLEFTYVAFDTVDTDTAIAAMRVMGIRGFSLTIPHKERVLALLDDATPEAEKIAAVNTVINDGEKLLGENTDWWGIVEAFKEAKREVKAARVLLIGAGGAARAAVYALQCLDVGSILISNRTLERAESLAAEFDVDATSFESLAKKDLKGFDVIVNSSAIGTKQSGAQRVDYPINLDSLTKKQLVFDMATVNTPLLDSACSAGAVAISGIRMLLFQALKQFELFTGSPAPMGEMEQALLEEYSRQEQSG
ncbi:hypothetical protein BVY02_01295 [bacterium J17]|nr:hypothetical protein BVY02_01295 [bacterium J17]